VPFDFLRRKKEAPPPTTSKTDTSSRPAVAGSGVPFEGLTEEWRLVGRMLIEGRLSDALNRREPIALADVHWASMESDDALDAAPGIKSVDPYDLVLVIAGQDSLPPMTEAERSAHKVHKVTYEVGLEVPPYRVVGTVQLYPGYEPIRLLERSNEMFVAVVNATATMGDRLVSEPGTDVVLVNRAYLRGVEQVDARTGERYEKLPGGSLGGAQWSDKTR
jgi:hypothetical protein